MKEQVFYTDVKPNGKIQDNVSLQLKEALPEYEGKRIYIKIGVSKKIRSLDQNAYYHGVIIECVRQGILDLWGEKINKEQAHDLLKTHCNFNEKINELTDSSIRVPMPTHNLTTTGFCEYTERCTKFIGEMFGINVPPPSSQADITFSE